MPVRKSVFKGGLTERSVAARTGRGDFQNIRFKDGEPIPVQFYGMPRDPNAFKEFEQHVWQAKYWNYIPCIGDGCVLCDDENEDIAKTSFGFVCQVYDLKSKKPMVISGSASLGQQVLYKAKRAGTRFNRRVYDVMRLATTPKSWSVDQSEDMRPLNLSSKAPIDLDKYLTDQYERYVKDHKARPSTLDDDEDLDELEDDEEIDEDEGPTHSQMMEMEWSELKSYAKSVGVTGIYKKRSLLIDAIEEEKDS